MSRKKKFRIREKRQRIPRLDVPEPAVRNERKQRVFVPKMVSPKTDNQARLIEAINQNDITIALGPAGTGKTHLSVGVAISMFRTNLVDHILISRPLVGAGEDSGALPGTDKQKILPYLRPLFDELAQFASQSELSEWQNVKELEIVPIQFMRGRTFKNSVIVVDEAQNATYEQLKMIISRLGEGSRMVIVADPEQTDLPPRAAGGINEMVKRLSTPNEEDGCSIVRLGEQDIVRHPILRKIMKRL